MQTFGISVALLLGLALPHHCFALGRQPGEAFIPSSDSEVLFELPARSNPANAALDRLRDRQRQHPEDLEAASQLARAYIDFGRRSGDARYLGRALAVVEPWLKEKVPPIDVLLIDATILQGRHQFEEAKAVLLGVLARDDEDIQAWLTLASIYQVQGEIENARHACARLMGGMDALVAATCVGELNAVTGRARNGYETIEALLVREPNEPPGIQAWAQGVMAEAAKTFGDPALAERHFKSALAQLPGDNFLLAAYADLLLDLNRPAEVLDLLRDGRQSDILLLRIALAEADLHSNAADDDAKALAQRFHDLEVRGDEQLYAREQARFELLLRHDAKRALAVALDDWTRQRAPEDVRIVLEVALAMNEPAAAKSALDFLHRTGLEDPLIRKLAEQLSSIPPSITPAYQP